MAGTAALQYAPAPSGRRTARADKRRRHRDRHQPGRNPAREPPLHRPDAREPAARRGVLVVHDVAQRREPVHNRPPDRHPGRHGHQPAERHRPALLPRLPSGRGPPQPRRQDRLRGGRARRLALAARRPAGHRPHRNQPLGERGRPPTGQGQTAPLRLGHHAGQLDVHARRDPEAGPGRTARLLAERRRRSRRRRAAQHAPAGCRDDPFGNAARLRTTAAQLPEHAPGPARSGGGHARTAAEPHRRRRAPPSRHHDRPPPPEQPPQPRTAHRRESRRHDGN